MGPAETVGPMTIDHISIIEASAAAATAALDAGLPAGAEIDAIWRHLSALDAHRLEANAGPVTDVLVTLPTKVSERLVRWLASHTEGEVALFWRHLELPVAV